MNIRLEKWLKDVSRTISEWLKVATKIPMNVVAIALITLVVSAIIASFPVPAPDMAIITPNNSQKFDVVWNETKDKLGEPSGEAPAKINVKIIAHPGLRRYLLYESEFWHRFFKNLRMDPKIWVLAKPNNSDKWTVFHEVPYFTNGYEIVQVPLWYPTTWDIAVFSFSSRDGEYLKGYKTTIDESGGDAKPIDVPESGVQKQKVTVTIINKWEQ